MFNELDVVRLRVSLPGEGLAAGAVGTIVHCFTQADVAFEVEFANSEGETQAMLPLQAHQIELAATDLKAA